MEGVGGDKGRVGGDDWVNGLLKIKNESKKIEDNKINVLKFFLLILKFDFSGMSWQ